MRFAVRWNGSGPTAMPDLAIVAALEREIHPLVRNWKSREGQHEGRSFRFFEKDNAVVICGGVGAEAARRAAEAVISVYMPVVVYSVGFAGALQSSLRVGDIVVARRVVD